MTGVQLSKNANVWYVSKNADEISNSVDPNKTFPPSSLIRVCTICSDLSVTIVRTISIFNSLPPLFFSARRPTNLGNGLLCLH